MKKKFYTVFFLFILILTFLFNTTSVFADNTYVYLGGMPAGFSIRTRGVSIVELSNVLTETGIYSPCKDANIFVGDTLLYIDGEEINSALDIEKNITNKSICTLILERSNEKIIKNIKPVKDINQKYKIGISVKDGINGIGTITFIKDNKFASLGHPVTNELGEKINIKDGILVGANITGVVKGKRFSAGELRGNFLTNIIHGKIYKNTEQGMYGDYINSVEVLNKIEIGEGKIGNASIFTTVNGEKPQEYTISIIKADLNKNSKNFVIKITDENLLNISNGIVQGMSGSPIVQDNKIIGAVTHVFINDSTRGFGISIQNMLNNM